VRCLRCLLVAIVVVVACR